MGGGRGGREAMVGKTVRLGKGSACATGVAVGEGGLEGTRVGKRQGWDSEMAG
jgi:hypothetical protein